MGLDDLFKTFDIVMSPYLYCMRWYLEQAAAAAVVWDLYSKVDTKTLSEKETNQLVVGQFLWFMFSSKTYNKTGTMS